MLEFSQTLIQKRDFIEIKHMRACDLIIHLIGAFAE